MPWPEKVTTRSNGWGLAAWSTERVRPADVARRRRPCARRTIATSTQQKIGQVLEGRASALPGTSVPSSIVISDQPSSSIEVEQAQRRGAAGGTAPESVTVAERPTRVDQRRQRSDEHHRDGESSGHPALTPDRGVVEKGAEERDPQSDAAPALGGIAVGRVWLEHRRSRRRSPAVRGPPARSSGSSPGRGRPRGSSRASRCTPPRWREGTER